MSSRTVNPDRSEVEFQSEDGVKHCLRFDLGGIRKLQIEFGVSGINEVLKPIAEFNADAVIKALAIGCEGLTEEEIEKMRIPLLKVVEALSKALSYTLFGTDTPPAPEGKEVESPLA